MTKLLLQDTRGVNLIHTALIGEDAINHYVSGPCEWFDGRHADVLYVPVTSPTENFPPVLIEIQNIVDKLFIRRLINDEWAQAHYFIDKINIASSLKTPLLPMVALTYVLIKQKISLLSLEHRDDPTVQMLYCIMKETLDHDVHNEETTVNVLLNASNNKRDQFKRIIEALEKDDDIKRTRLYSGDGLLYAQTYIQKYSQTSSSTMSEPLTLPREVAEGSNARKM